MKYFSYLILIFLYILKEVSIKIAKFLKKTKKIIDLL